MARYPTRCLAVPALVAALLLALLGCKDFGFQPGPKAVLSGFDGIKSINITPDGHYVLFWDNVSGVADITTVTYEVYFDKWSALPAGLTTQPVAPSVRRCWDRARRGVRPDGRRDGAGRQRRDPVLRERGSVLHARREDRAERHLRLSSARDYARRHSRPKTNGF